MVSELTADVSFNVDSSEYERRKKMKKKKSGQICCSTDENEKENDIKGTLLLNKFLDNDDRTKKISVIIMCCANILVGYPPK